MPYAAASDVAALCRSLLGPERTFSESSCPTLTQVNAWLSSGSMTINTLLAQAGYSTPVASTVDAYGWMKELNTLWAAYHAELSRSGAILSAGERGRAQVLSTMFWDEWDRLKKLDLSMAGVSRSSTGKLFVGGISVSDKQTRESDSDRTVPRFSRGQFSFPGVLDPGPSTAS